MHETNESNKIIYSAVRQVDLPQIALKTIEILEKNTVNILLLKGDLGAGKTTFTKALAAQIGVTSLVTSPTYTINKSYPLPSGQPWGELTHWDCYRLDEWSDFVTVGLEEAVKNKNIINVIEWPQALELQLQRLKLPFIIVSFAESADREIRNIKLELGLNRDADLA